MFFVVIQFMKFMNQRMIFFFSICIYFYYYFLFSFTVHGFRYVAISAPPNNLALDDVECPFVHSETTLKGNFTSSNPIINQIQHNILWGQLSNSMSLPTDWYVFDIDIDNIETYFIVLVHNVMNVEDGWVMQH